jgi:hypothetical protein
MTLRGWLDPGGDWIRDLAVHGDRAWVCWPSLGVGHVDLTDPDAPALIGDIVPLPGSPQSLYLDRATGAVYVDCDLAGVHLVVAGPDGAPVHVGGGGVRTRGLGPADGWIRTFGAVMPPALLDLTASPATPTPAASMLTAAPNPFNPRTTIRYTVPVAGPVRLSVHDLRGRLVRVLVDGEVAMGTAEAIWNGRDQADRGVAAGVYLVRLTTPTGAASGRVCLVR